MKKIKMLCVTAATYLAAVSPMVIATSCGGKHKDIDIKINPNIQIDCDEITIGKELVIKYKIDSGYAFDIEKSTITFEDSNVTISLIQCDVDRIHQTITVPGEFVVSKKVTIDIKAEDCKDSTIENEQEYKDAIKKLTVADANRLFTTNISMHFYEQLEGEEAQTTLEVKAKLEAKGFKERQIQQQIYYEPQPGTYTTFAWAEKDDIVGNWVYVSDGTTPTKGSAIETFAVATFVAMFESEELSKWSNFKYDPLYNAYYAHFVVEQSQETLAFLKFNNKKISFIGGVGGNSSQGKISAVSESYEIEYACDDIKCPTIWQYASPNEIHNEPSKYAATSNGVMYTYDNENDDFLGRYTVPLNLYANWDNNKSIKITIDASIKSGLSAMDVAIANGDNVIDPSKYTYDPTYGTIEVKNGVINTSQNLIVVLASHNSSHVRPSMITYTAFKVYQ